MSLARGSQNAGHFYSNIGMPYKIDCNFVVDSTNGNGLGIRSLKSNGYVQNVFMHTSATPGVNNGYTNPNPALGYALIQMKQNFNTYLGGFSGQVAPTVGATAVINGSALTVGNPYIIATVGATPKAAFTVAAVADSAGSLAGTYFTATDIFQNHYVFYNVVSGVGTAPSLTGTLLNYTAVPVTFATNAANSTVGAALATAMGAVNGANSWTAVNSGHTVTVTNVGSATLTFSPGPADVNTGFTISGVTYTQLAADWQHVGLQPGLTPTVGQSFIALTTGGAVGSGTVISPGVSGVMTTEVVGDPNASINNASIAANGGAWVLVQFLEPGTITFTGSTHTSTTVDTLTPTNPITAGVRVGMQISGTGIPLGTTVAAVSSSAITLSAAATATASGVALTVGPASVVTQPFNSSVVGMSFFFDRASFTIDGL